MPLILLRHTRPIGAEGICYGRTDLPLATDFAAEATRLARDLPPVARIVSSPLSRCRRLAQAIGAARALPVGCDPRLIEMDFGAWENTPWDALPRDQLDAWRDDFLAACPHGGECVRDLDTRTRAALSEHAQGGQEVLVVTHAGVIKAALAAQGDSAGWRAQIDFGDWLRVDWR